ncbi:MAG TPA: MFS transporter [Gammaproteobacteria bacterium]|nr:MFS transporter [Gammaproteobacteria bacterium]
MKNINKNVIYLGWVSFFTDFSSSMVTTLLPLYVVYILDEGVDKLGIVIAVASFVSYAFRIVFGYISDRYALVKPLVVTGYLVSALTKPMLALTHGYVGVAAMRGIERMGKAVRSAPKDALISAYSEAKKSGKTFGFHKTMDIAGELGGAALIFLVLSQVMLDKESIRLIFASTLIPGLIATAIALFLVKDVDQSSLKATRGPSVFNKSDLKLLPLLFIYFAAVMFILSDQFLIVKARESGYANTIIPLFVMVLTLTQTLSSYYSGLMIDKIGSERMLLMAIVFGALSVACVWQSLIWPGFIFLGLFTVISLNTVRAYISNHAQSKAFVFGIFYGGVAFASSLGAVIIGQLWKHLGFEDVVLFSLTGLGVVTIALLILIWRSKRDLLY